ncbi:MAG: cysteine desulfurase [Lachnospiraceae bacterium]|nr:cysteine desulfurase [Lachnospiraceae bacterium]
MIYLDYSANTPVDSEVLDCFVKTEQTYMGNPNAAHPAGRAAQEKLAKVTASVAAMLEIDPVEIIYTSGASEANNLAIKGIARSQRHLGKHILSTALEHPSVSGPLTYLQEQGYEIDLVNIGRDGRIDLEQFRELLRKDTILVAVSAVDSELGVIQPIEEIAAILQNFPNCRLHVDATQAIGKIPFSFAGIDTVSLTAHKFYGLNGCGMLYKRKELVIEPLIHGGTGASLYRSGTPTLSLIASLETALHPAMEYLAEREAYVRRLNDDLRAALADYPQVRINSPAQAVPHILNLSVSGVKGTQFRQKLGEQGVCVSVKSACSTEETPSKAVFAVSRDRKNAMSSWRISLSHLTTKEELEEFLRIFDRCYRELL